MSFRLTRLWTTRTSGSTTLLQDLHYFYDPVGNITTIRDDVDEPVYFANQQVSATQEFVYDPIYRLISATGREHAGGIGDDQRDQNDLPLWNLPHPNDAQALRGYTETYAYDGVGNLLEMFHDAGGGSSPGTWRRRYAYGTTPFGGGAPVVPDSNRLHSTSLPGDAATGPYSATYSHDANGNMTAMPHLASLEYTHADQMRKADLGGGGTAYYTYDASGERVRKVIQRIGTTREERIYLGGWELYRKRQGANGDLVLERETLHVMDDTRRIAMVDTKTVDADVSGTLSIVPRLRFQYTNHLDSAHLECDETGLVISYEEYHPYGTPAYRSASAGVEVSEKRYRYTGKERDEETGFQYHSARYYSPWLGRWTSADPKRTGSGPALYVYCRSNPVEWADTNGAEETKPFDPQEGNWFVKWLLYDTSPGAVSSIKDAITSDRNLQVAQNGAVGVSVVAGTIATGGALYGAAAGAGAGTVAAGAVAGGGSSMFAYGAQGLYDGREVDPVDLGIQVVTGAAMGAAFAVAPKIGQWLGTRSAASPPEPPIPAVTKQPATISTPGGSRAPKPPAGVHAPPGSTPTNKPTGGAAPATVVAGQARLPGTPRGVPQPNPNGQVRTLPEALKIAEDAGVNVDLELFDFKLKPGLPPNVGAEYGRTPLYDSTGRVPIVEMDRFIYRVPDGRIAIKINPNILSSDENIVQTLAHETFEALEVEAAFIQQGARMRADVLHGLVNAETGTLHVKAWEFADTILCRFRSTTTGR
ncbi:MAG: RHS repeat-associated core domain-containing protein [Polyangiaceae bacterium]